MLLDDEAQSLRTDVYCILVECSRDRGLAALRDDATGKAIETLADELARRLAPRIGGRYVPKGMYRSGWEQRVARDQAIWAKFNGRNHRELQVEFGISRRLLYSILSRRPRARG